MSALRRLCVPALIALLGASPLAAQSLGDILSAELMPGWKTESGTHIAAIRLQLSQGWKTYWRSPGEAGIPPEFNWAGSDNIGRVEIHWPTPQVFIFNGMRSIGYAKELILPVEIWPARAQEAVRLDTSVDLGVCHDVCVPATVKLSGVLSSKGNADPSIRAALNAQPISARRAGLTAARCHIEPMKRGLRLSAELEMPRLGANEVVVIETADARVWVSEADSRRLGDKLYAEVDLVGPGRKPFALDRSGLTMTVLAEGRAVEVTGCQGG